MKQNTLQMITAAAFALAAGSAVVVAQSKTGAADAHVAAAKAATGQDHLFMFNQLCAPPAAPAPAVAAPAAPQPSPPDRSQWHVEPVKVFDNLYFVGQSEFSAWAVKTSAGIILVDTIFDYSVEDEVVGGLKKLELDPRRSSMRSSAMATATTRAVRSACRKISARASSCPRPTGTCWIAARVSGRSATWWPPTGRSSHSAIRR